jgi:bifunctional DNA-binding transcriptional regulator/antitoxin component of YhaV-PrlF toxin-antitoxin module
VATTHIDGGKVLIPEEIREAAHLTDGTELEVEITAVGILLRTPQPIDPDQAWFWTKEWQAGEREADEEIKAGKGEFFASGEEFLAALEAEAKRLGDADV